MASQTDSTFTVMTDKGLALASQLLNKTNSIESFRAIGSDTSYYDKPSDAQGLTDLKPVKQTGEISELASTGDTTSEIQIDFDLTKLDAYYTLATVGLYATDKNGVEILYAVECNQHPQPMEVSTTGDMNSHFMELVVGNAEQINVTVSPASSVSKSEFEAKIATLYDTEKLKKYLADNKFATEDYVDDKVKNATPKLPDNLVTSNDDGTLNVGTAKKDYAEKANVITKNPDTGEVAEQVNFGTTNPTTHAGDMYLSAHQSDDEDKAVAAAKAATMPGWFWNEEK